MAEPREPLTERELEVVKLVAEGASNKQIAAALFISENTVKVHLKNIFVKLEAESRARVASIAQRNGWVISPALESVMAAPQDIANVAEAAAPIEPAVIAPVPVAPNPEPLPPQPLWRRVATVLVVLVTILGGALSLQAGRTRAQPVGEDEFSGAPDAGSASSASSRWFLRAPIPAARTRAAAFGINGKIYLIGGTLDRAAIGDTQLYEPARNAWSDGPAKPTPLRLAAGALITTVIYMPGGTDMSGAATDRFEALDTVGGVWLSLPPLPRAVSGHAVAADDAHVFVFGGKTSNESFNTDGFVFDVAARRWSRVKGLPIARSQASAAVLDGRVYVVGGTDGQREYPNCDVYTVESQSWAQCKPLTIARGGLGLARIGSRLYAIGGGVAGNYIPFNERFDVADDRWTPFETPLSRAGIWKNAAVASLPTEFYVIGGSTGPESRTDVYVYEVLTNKSFLPSTQSNTP